jgi:hypothetical protein
MSEWTGNVFYHKYPANTIGVTTPIINSGEAGSLLVHNVENSIWLAGSSPSRIGYIPATSDGDGGVQQLARDIDIQYYPQQYSNFTIGLSGTTLTVSWPNILVLWNGAMQQLNAGSLSQTVSTGLYSLVVGYQWGLTVITLVLTSSLSPTGNGAELCEINVNTTAVTATASTGMVNSKWIDTLCIGGPSNTTYSVPTSGSNSQCSW